MKQEKTVYTYLPYVGVILLLAIASFYDYEIAKYLYNPSNVFGIFFERIALVFVIFLIPFSFYGLYRVRKQMIWLFCFVLGALYWVMDSMHYWISISSYIYYVVPLSFVIIFITYQVLKRVPTTFFKQYERFLRFSLLIFLSSMAITFLWKSVWGRVRYREMLDMATLFTPWYSPQGLTGFNSFPSGHTTAMSTILCFLEVHRVKSAKMPRNKIVCVGIVALIFMMMFSRMIMGAHFLSDVCMGFTITYTMYLFWKRKIYWEDRL